MTTQRNWPPMPDDYRMSRVSEDNLNGVHKDLAKVIRTAHFRGRHDGFDFRVTEGLRTTQRQRELVAAGASKTMNSRHITGHAVDCYPYRKGRLVMNWDGGSKEADAAREGVFTRMVNYIREAAKDLKVEVDFGYDWGWDGPHIELDRKAYPARASK